MYINQRLLHLVKCPYCGKEVGDIRLGTSHRNLAKGYEPCSHYWNSLDNGETKVMSFYFHENPKQRYEELKSKGNEFPSDQIYKESLMITTERVFVVTKDYWYPHNNGCFGPGKQSFQDLIPIFSEEDSRITKIINCK